MTIAMELIISNGPYLKWGTPSVFRSTFSQGFPFVIYVFVIGLNDAEGLRLASTQFYWPDSGGNSFRSYLWLQGFPDGHCITQHEQTDKWLDIHLRDGFLK